MPQSPVELLTPHVIGTTSSLSSLKADRVVTKDWRFNTVAFTTRQVKKRDAISAASIEGKGRISIHMAKTDSHSACGN